MLDILFPLAEVAAHAAEGGAYDSFLNRLLPGFGLDERIVVSQAISFAIVAILLWRFAFRPVIATMDERQHKIAEGLQFAEEAKQQLAESERRSAETLRQANAEAQRILHEANERAKAHEERLRAETALQLDDLRHRHAEGLERERQKMLSEVRQEIARLVVLTTGKVLRNELSAEERSRINQAAAREISSLS